MKKEGIDVKGKYKTITKKTLKILFANSNNQCSFPNCNIRLVDEEKEIVLADICHNDCRTGIHRADLKEFRHYRESLRVYLCPPGTWE